MVGTTAPMDVTRPFQFRRPAGTLAPVAPATPRTDPAADPPGQPASDPARDPARRAGPLTPGPLGPAAGPALPDAAGPDGSGRRGGDLTGT